MKRITLALTLLVLTISPAAAENMPEQFVGSIYTHYKGTSSKAATGVDLTGDKILDYFTPDLARLIKDDNKGSEEVPCLNGDPFVFAQDWDIPAFDIKIINDDKDHQILQYEPGKNRYFKAG